MPLNSYEVMMELIPAIDILDNKAVRLHKGRYDSVTIYAEDVVALARGFAEAGAKRLHVVDLEGARQGRPVHGELLRAIIAATALEVQVAGGLRSRALALEWLALGAARVVVGTLAIKEPDVVRALCREFPGRIVVALDANHGKIATEGWLEASELDLTTVASDVATWGPESILCTAIERDGTEIGPDLEALSALQRRVSCPVIASGGIGTVEHLTALQRAGLPLAVCGRALYEQRFGYADACRALAEDAALEELDQHDARPGETSQSAPGASRAITPGEASSC